MMIRDQRITREKLAPMQVCPPQISCVLKVVKVMLQCGVAEHIMTFDI
jgi:hypothetical protein